MNQSHSGAPHLLRRKSKELAHSKGRNSTADANINRGIGKGTPPEDGATPAPAQPEKPRMTDFKPYWGNHHKPDTGCISEITVHLLEGRYSPTWPNGKKHVRNVYAKTREECEEKLEVLIVQMKQEIAELKAEIKG